VRDGSHGYSRAADGFPRHLPGWGDRQRSTTRSAKLARRGAGRRASAWHSPVHPLLRNPDKNIKISLRHGLRAATALALAAVPPVFAQNALDFTLWDIFRNLLLAARWTVVAFVGGGVVGLALLVARIAKLPAADLLVRGYLQLFQGTPLQGTALASVIVFIELTKAGTMITNATLRPFTVYACLALMYFALCCPISAWSKSQEKKLHGRR